MNHASLFTGIGGFDIAAQWMGWVNLFNCEIDPFCKQVLKYHFPNAEQFSDIKTTDFTKYNGLVDIISGGFPCQPFSMAGKRKGTDDPRHLWPEMLRTIREIQPRWVVGENVGGLLNWSGGLVFEQVQADLEAEGYEVQAFVLPACAVNAPHRRDRVWIVAYGSDRIRWKRPEINNGGVRRNGMSNTPCELSKFRSSPDTEVTGSEGKCIDGQGKIQLNGRNSSEVPTRWEQFPTQPPVRRRDDGFSGQLDGITFSKLRNESIKAYGNAIVPEVAYEIFKAIEKTENDENTN